jgi:NSS family neurotransmitter:Na+ symporter
MGLSLMDFCDMLTAQYLLPLGAFLTSIFVGWFASQEKVCSEFTNNSETLRRLFPYYQFSVRFIVPLGILLIFLHQLDVI